MILAARPLSRMRGSMLLMAVNKAIVVLEVRYSLLFMAANGLAA